MPSRRDGRKKTPASSLEAVVTGDAHRQQTILIVEDDPALLSFYKSALMIEGFTIVTAADGVEALHRIDHGPPDLIVLDLGLPRLSGLDLRREIAAHAHTRHIPILVATGQTDVDPGEFDCVLQKPVDAATLVAAVEECLRQRPPLI
jgi:DNA-binding response OmpR family regulator